MCVAVLLLKKVKDIPEDALVDISGAKVSLYSFSFPIRFCASPTSSYCTDPLIGIAFTRPRSRPFMRPSIFPENTPMVFSTALLSSVESFKKSAYFEVPWILFVYHSHVAYYLFSKGDRIVLSAEARYTIGLKYSTRFGFSASGTAPVNTAVL